MRVCLALIIPAGAGALPGCGDLPPYQPRPIPALALGSTLRATVVRAYGQPTQKTANELWYVGPGPKGLMHGADGWMTLLTFDDEGHLQCQEFLRRRPEQGYVQVQYWIDGRLDDRNRGKDFDRLMMTRCVDLARENSEYSVTTEEAGLFVLARLLPSENEPVVQWRFEQKGDLGRVGMTVQALPGRDEPLMEKIDGAVGLRMLLIEIPNDADVHPATEHTFGPTR